MRRTTLHAIVTGSIILVAGTPLPKAFAADDTSQTNESEHGEAVTRIDQGSSATASHGMVSGTGLKWRKVALDVPVNFHSDYDPRCDYRSRDFKFHNLEELRQDGFETHRFSSLTGVGTALFAFLKVFLALVFAPLQPIAPMNAWIPDEECEKTWERAKQNTGNFELTEEEFLHACTGGKLACGNFDKLGEEKCRDLFNIIKGDAPVLNMQALEGMRVQREFLGHENIGLFCGEEEVERYGHVLRVKSGQRIRAEVWSQEIFGYLSQWSLHQKDSQWIGHQKDFMLYLQLAAGKGAECGLEDERRYLEWHLQRYRPGDDFHLLSLAQMIPSSSLYEKGKLRQYVQGILCLPAQTLGFNLPWTLGFQASLFFGQCAQAMLEIGKTAVLGRPHFLSFWHWEWFILTFHADVFLPIAYMGMRIWVISYLLWTFTGGRDSAYGPVALAPLVYFAAVYVIAYLPFLPMTALCVLVGSLFAWPCCRCCETMRPTAKDLEAGGLTLGRMLLLIGCCMIYPSIVVLLVSAALKAIFIKDTYLCSFSRLVIIGDDRSSLFRIDFSSMIGYVTVSALLTLCVGVRVAVSACCPKVLQQLQVQIITPYRAYVTWIREPRNQRFLHQVPGLDVEMVDFKTRDEAPFKDKTLCPHCSHSCSENKYLLQQETDLEECTVPHDEHQHQQTDLTFPKPPPYDRLPPPCPPSPPRPMPAFVIMVVGARGIRNSEWMPGLGKPDCYCEVKRGGKSLYTTKTIDCSLMPCWAEEFEVWELDEMEELEFKVYDRDAVGSDYLGKVVVAPDVFAEKGCTREFLMDEAGANIKAYLGLRITPRGPPCDGQLVPYGDGPAPEFEITVEKGKGSKEYGLEIDSQDLKNLQITNVNPGAFKAYNETAEPDVQVITSDFIVSVNSVTVDAFKMMTEFNNPKVNVKLLRALDTAVLLENTDKKKKHGLKFPPKLKQDVLVVMEIGDGYIKEHNDKCESESQKILPYDRIVMVKGQVGKAAILKKLLEQATDKFQVGIQRPCPVEASKAPGGMFRFW